MIYKIVVDKQPMTNPSQEKKEYEIDIEELHFKRDVYDSIVITLNEDYVMRRLSLGEYNVLTELDPPVKEPLENINIELFEGDNYIYLYDMAGNKIVAQYLIKNEFNELYITQSEMNSAINQSARGIEIAVNRTLEGYSTTQQMNSAINLKADEISSVVSTKVGEDEIISKINQSAEQIQIQADKIDIDGKAVHFKTNINDTRGPYTQTDLTRVRNIIVGNIIPTTEDYEKYDIDGDGRIDTADNFLITKAIADNNGYINGTGTFEINPYTIKRTLALYNDSLNDYSALISLYSSYFNELSSKKRIKYWRQNNTHI